MQLNWKFPSIPGAVGRLIPRMVTKRTINEPTIGILRFWKENIIYIAIAQNVHTKMDNNKAYKNFIGSEIILKP